MTVVQHKGYLTESILPITPDDDIASVDCEPQTGCVAMHINQPKEKLDDGIENPNFVKLKLNIQKQ